MRNIIDAIITLVQSDVFNLNDVKLTQNRANNQGIPLEEYVKDIFADSLIADSIQKAKMHNQVFSYEGNQNNPPDAMIKGGDAIEIKKMQSLYGSLPLNSSHPKDKLYKSSTLLSSTCKTCEEWAEKDMIYAVGITSGKKISALAFVYGDVYCAKKETYEKIFNPIKVAINELPDIDFTPSNELAHVNKVDPLGITYFRARGMWGIDNPFKVFEKMEGIYNVDFNYDFNFVTIMREDKWKLFSNSNQLELIAKNSKNLSIQDKEALDPNNKAALIKVKVISYKC